MASVLTTCPFCACGCGLYLHADEAGLSGVGPSEHHPASRGRLCARGWNAHEATAWGVRLTRATVRRGDTPHPVGYAQAVHDAAEALAAVRARGDAVGVLGSGRASNEENYLAARLARAAIATPNVDACLRQTYQPVVTGMLAASDGLAPTGTLDDVETAEVVLLVEGDLARTHPQAAHAVIAARKHGATLVTLGIARTQLAHLATLHIPVRPGGRAAALDALTLDGGGDAGLVTRWLTDARHAAFLIPQDGGPPGRAGADATALAALARRTGHLGRPRCAVLPLPVRSNLRGACEMGVTPDLLPGWTPLGDRRAAERLAGVWGRAPVVEAGLDIERMLGRVRAVVIVQDDLAVTSLAEEPWLAALADLECVVVLDSFATATTAAATVALPVAAFGETEGTVTSADGRVQRVRAAAPPPGDARPGWEALAELTSALGLTSPYRSANDVLREIAAAVPGYAGVDERIAEGGWGAVVAPASDGRYPPVAVQGAPRVEPGGMVLSLDGALDWGADPLVRYSPTLRREPVSQRKLYPAGMVEMCKADADDLGIRQGWRVRVASRHGTAVLPVALRTGLDRGVLTVPFALRESVAGLLHGDPEVAVTVERAS